MQHSVPTTSPTTADTGRIRVGGAWRIRRPAAVPAAVVDGSRIRVGGAWRLRAV
jgi:hypothetical protein